MELEEKKPQKSTWTLQILKKSFKTMRLYPLKDCNPTSLHGRGALNVFSHITIWGEVCSSNPKNFNYIFKAS